MRLPVRTILVVQAAVDWLRDDSMTIMYLLAVGR